MGDSGRGLQPQGQQEEVKRLTQWVHDLQSGMWINCVYCGHRYGPAESTAATMQEALYEHIRACPKHPLCAAERRIAELEHELAELRDRDDVDRQRIAAIVWDALWATSPQDKDDGSDCSWEEAQEYEGEFGSLVYRCRHATTRILAEIGAASRLAQPDADTLRDAFRAGYACRDFHGELEQPDRARECREWVSRRLAQPEGVKSDAEEI